MAEPSVQELTVHSLPFASHKLFLLLVFPAHAHCCLGDHVKISGFGAQGYESVPKTLPHGCAHASCCPRHQRDGRSSAVGHAAAAQTAATSPLALA